MAQLPLSTEQARAAFDELDQDRELRRENIHEYRSLERSIREAFCAYLAEQNFYPEVPEIVVNEVAQRAWDDGHSGGVEEVEFAYQDYAALVNLTINAVRAQA